MTISLGTVELSAIGDYTKVSLGTDLIWESDETPVGPVYLTNLAAYNQTTWATWNKGTGVTAESTGMTIPIPLSGYATSKYSLGLVVGKKYGVLYNIVSNTISGNSIFCAIADYNITYFLNSDGATGIKKYLFTPSDVSQDRIFSAMNKSGGTGSAKFKDFRIFELPTGSQVEADFTNAVTQAQIDALSVKYPFVSAAKRKL